MKITDLFITTADKAAAQAVERRWLNWLGDPAHNTAPNPKANAATAQREYKAVGGGGLALEYATGAFHFERSARGERRTPPTPTTPADPLGNTMITRAQAEMIAILRERQRDPEPSREDFVSLIYWDRREQKRRARMSHWRQYLP